MARTRKQQQQPSGGLTSLFSSSGSNSSSSSSSAWQWRPSCSQPRTLSFRQQQQQAYKTMNSAYSPDSDSFASVDSSCSIDEAVVARALRSGRLSVDPAGKAPPSSACILEAAKEEEKTAAVLGGATAMTVESRNPYRDFRESMEAVVVSRRRAEVDWRWLEEMLGWYIGANAKATHGLIVAAFVDLLLALSATSPPPSSPSPATSSSTPASSSPSSFS
ncbi:hypothetical protein ACP70R_002728 [Stipagrostis hirtigluma subsp. patula]